MMRHLVLFLLVLGLIVPTPVTSQEEGIPTSMEIDIHRLINEVRADKDMHNQDLAPLKLHSVLIDVARAHSQDMLERDYFDHISPEGEEPADRVSEAGVEYSAVGENLYYSQGTAEENIAENAVDGWVDSPGHYANIITGYSFTGIGVAQVGETFYITQVFVNADPAHLEEIGQIYENDELDDIEDEKSSFTITARTASIIAIVVLLVLGVYAGRQNDRYYGRRR